jgi:hypothetical protein
MVMKMGREKTSGLTGILRTPAVLHYDFADFEF